MTDSEDAVLVALDAVVAMAAENITRLETVIERTNRLRAQRRSGLNYREIAAQADRPVIVELLSQTLLSLQHASHQLRRAAADALYDEGMSMAQIGHLFGVSRQRVAVVLRPENSIERGAGSGDSARHGSDAGADRESWDRRP